MFGAGFRASRRVLTSGLKALPFLAVAKADEGAPVELVFDGSLPVDEPVKKVHHPHGSEIDHEADLMRVPSDYISNPGLYDEMQAEGRLFDLDEYEGLKIDYLRPLQPGVSLVHAVHLTGVEDEVSTYSCMAQMMSLETGEYVVARFDSNLDFFGRAQFGIGNVLVNMMLRNEEGNPDPTGSIDMNYFMPTSTIGVKLMPSEGQSSLSFYQTVSPSFSIGTEILHVEPVAFTLLRMGAKLFRSYGILSGMVGTNGVALAQYVREFEPRRMALFTEYLLMPTQNGLESTVKFGYRQQFSDEVCVTTKFGTDWRIQTQLETDVRGLGKFSLLGNVDQNTGKYKMGVCLSVTN